MTTTRKALHVYHIGFMLVCTVLCLVNTMDAQTTARDTARHPYHVNYWVSGGILAVGLVAEKIGVPWISSKRPISIAEYQAVDRNDVTAIDRWALNQDPSNMSHYVQLSDHVLAGIVVLPIVALLDHDIRHDWLDVLLMYLETVVLTNNTYLYAPFGPTFQNRLRPVVYYDALGDSEVRTRGSNRNSFYSGHVASAASASFFTAKVFCDYHPELGWKKYLVYAAAAVPPLALSYVRLKALSHFPSDLAVGMGLGALYGILVPEMHRISMDNASLGMYSSFEGTGIRLTWRPNMEK